MKRIKYIILSMLAGLVVLPAYTQSVSQDTKAFIVEEMKEFSGTLNNVLTLFMEDAIEPETMDVLFGGDYMKYNGVKYGKLSSWINRYYRNQLKGVELNHTFLVRQPSIRKLSTSEADRRYIVETTMKRASAIKDASGRHDYKLEDRNVTFTVVVNEGHRMTVVGIDGNLDFNPIYPQNRNRLTLELSSKHSEVSSWGGDHTFHVTSYSCLDKVYGNRGELGIESGTQRQPYAFYVKSALKTDRTGDDVTVHIPSNYSRDRQSYSVHVYQLGDNGYPFNSQYHTIFQEGMTGMWTLDANQWDVNLHYGFNGTLGLSTTWNFEDTRFAFGGYFAVTPKLLHYWRVEQSVSHSTGTTTVTDGNYEIKTTYLCPQVDGYSTYVDPDNEAELKDMHVYAFLQPGFYLTSFLRLDIGLGAAMTQETFSMAKHYDAKIIEYTPLLPDLAPQTIYTCNEWDISHDLVYKGKPQWNFAIRPAIDFQIPVSDSWFLNIGGGYIFALGNKDANTVDVTAGIGYAF